MTTSTALFISDSNYVGNSFHVISKSYPTHLLRHALHDNTSNTSVGKFLHSVCSSKCFCLIRDTLQAAKLSKLALSNSRPLYGRPGDFNMFALSECGAIFNRL